MFWGWGWIRRNELRGSESIGDSRDGTLQQLSLWGCTVCPSHWGLFYLFSIII